MLTIAVALLCFGATARAQDTPVSGRCATPDTIVFRGAERTGDAMVRNESGLVPGPVNYRTLERAIKAIYATGQFDDVAASCVLADGRSALTFTLKERPVLGSFDVAGTDRISRGSVHDKIELTPGKPLDPAQVARAVKRIDSVYQAGGYYLARVKPETTVVNGQVNLLFRIQEGRRLAVSGVKIEGNEALRDKTVVKAMATRPEGFMWWKKGELDNDKMAADVSEKIPGLYASRGFIDARRRYGTSAGPVNHPSNQYDLRPPVAYDDHHSRSHPRAWSHRRRRLWRGATAPLGRDRPPVRQLPRVGRVLPPSSRRGL